MYIVIVDEMKVNDVSTGRVMVVIVVLTLGGYCVSVVVVEMVDIFVLVAALRVRRGPCTVVLTVLVEY